MKKTLLFSLVAALFSLEAGSYERCCPSAGCDWVITPNAGPCVDCGWDAHITAAYIYWTPRLDGLTFAPLVTIDPATDQIVGTGSLHEPDWNYRSGFKIGVGYLLDCDGWDIDLTYTWLREKNTRETVITGPNQIIGDVYTESSKNWELSYDVLDLELGRNFFISRLLTLRPHFGLKGTWMKHDIYFNQESVITFSDATRERVKVWGVGARGGLDTAWHLCWGFSLLGDIALTAIWEQFNAKSVRDFIPPAEGEPLTVFNAKLKRCVLNPVAELMLGLRWETWVCCNTYHFSLDLGWEAQWWANQNQFLLENQGDLSLQGLTLQARFDF